MLPNAAVQRDGSDRYVWVDQDGKLARRTVTVGTRDASFTEIRQGVSPADKVLIGPQPEAGAASQAGNIMIEVSTSPGPTPAATARPYRR